MLTFARYTIMLAILHTAEAMLRFWGQTGIELVSSRTHFI